MICKQCRWFMENTRFNEDSSSTENVNNDKGFCLVSGYYVEVKSDNKACDDFIDEDDLK